ncbi:MAG: NAD(P)-binding domain-containing protein [Rhodobacteraceae bacterium]|nr:NAD(P)-binding domain-containing protein [Paracoccaceae bacterium]
MSRIGLVGTGHIAAPIARFLAARGHAVTVTRRSEAVSAALAQSHGIAVLGSAQAVVDACEIVFLCLRPQQAEAVIAPLTFRADHAVVSVMAGVSEAALRGWCAPAARLVQTIPFGFLEQGGCPLAAYGDAALLDGLFAPVNPVIPVASEAALNQHFAISAMLPGLLDLMVTARDWLVERTGDDSGAERYVAQLAGGFLASLDATEPGILERERDALATPGTLSLQMTTGLRAGGAHRALSDTLSAIGTRLEGR